MIFLLKPSFIFFLYFPRFFIQTFMFWADFPAISQPRRLTGDHATSVQKYFCSSTQRSKAVSSARSGRIWMTSGWLLDDLEHTDYLPVTRLVARLVRKGQNLTQSDVCQAVSWDIWVWVDSSQHWCLPPEILGSRIVGVYLGYMPNRN